MFWKKSILAKMILGIIIPIILVFVSAGSLILVQVSSSLSEVTAAELSSRSEAASYQVSEFFTKYTEVVKQMAANHQMKKMMMETASGQKITDSPSYADASETMNNILQSDSENLSLVWMADLASGESARSGGVVKGMPDYDITERSWYKELMEKKELFITEPYEDSSTGSMVLSIMNPVFNGNTLMGGVAIDLSIDEVNAMMGEYKLGKTGFFMLTTAEGTLIHHPNEELENKNITEANVSDNLVQAVSGGTAQAVVYESDGVEVHGYISPVGNSGWSVITGMPSDEFFAGYNAVKKNIFITFSIGLLIMAAAIILISSGIIRPLKRLSKAANEIAEGHLEVQVDTKSTDETGQVSQALSRTVTRLKDYINYIEEISFVLNDIAAGNIDFKLNHEYAGEFAKIKDALLHISDTLNETLSQIRVSAEQVASGSDQVSSGAQALSQGAAEQASSIEELAAAIGEISHKVKSNAENAAEAKARSGSVGREVERSSGQMSEMIKAISEINSRSAEIGKIIKTIEDIAFQTNILALNAAVEAARAGEAGKGFAVVADEVRNLASKSAEAAKNTTALIEGSVKAVQNGTKIADGTAASLTEVVNGTRDIIGIIDQISIEFEEEALSISQVDLGVDQISSVVQTNSATAEESAAASEQLSGQAQMLNNLVSRFKLKSDRL